VVTDNWRLIGAAYLARKTFATRLVVTIRNQQAIDLYGVERQYADT